MVKFYKDRIKYYDYQMLINADNVAKLQQFLFNGLLGNHDCITEQQIHGAVEFYIANKKKGIELDVNLSEEEKTKQKDNCDIFYKKFESELKKHLVNIQ